MAITGAPYGELDPTSLITPNRYCCAASCRGGALSVQPRLTSTFDDNYVTEINRRMAMYVERSEQLPLSVVVHVHYLPTKNNAQAHSLWRILLSLSHRWKRVELIVEAPSESLVHDLGTCRGKIPILESLTVSIRGSAQLLPLDAFEIAPRLGRRST
jgi:hypothetical protein